MKSLNIHQNMSKMYKTKKETKKKEATSLPSSLPNHSHKNLRNPPFCSFKIHQKSCH
jgi:hypothetical protein